jgi:hypothetical protein
MIDRLTPWANTMAELLPSLAGCSSMLVRRVRVVRTQTKLALVAAGGILLLASACTGASPSAQLQQTVVAQQTEIARLQTAGAERGSLSGEPTPVATPRPLGLATGSPPPASALTVSPESATFPTSWLEQDIEVTVVRLVDEGVINSSDNQPSHGIRVEVAFRNLAHERRFGGAIGYGFRLKTDRQNIYDATYLAYLIDEFQPEEIKQARTGFRIRPDETPVELWGYRAGSSHGGGMGPVITRIWKVG